MAEAFERQLASSERLLRLFHQGFSVMDLAEPLLSLDESATQLEAKALVERERLELLGVRQQGRLAGYVRAVNLTGEGSLTEFRVFAEAELVDDTADFQRVLARLAETDYVFVRVLGEVTGAIGQWDLEKPPMRMWLFGTISLMEMNVSWGVQQLYPGETWMEKLSQGRLEKAQLLQEERNRRGQHAQLLQCLQFSDKLRILVQEEEYRQYLLPGESRRGAERLIKRLESLRNNLAHSQPIVANNWAAMQELATAMDGIIKAERLRSLVLQHHQ